MVEDLGIKIGTPEEKFWQDLKKATEERQLNNAREKEINEAVLVLADLKIAEEKEKLK